MANHIILFGPPAAGKGTQASGIAKATKKTPTSTGDMLRKAVADGTETGLRAGEIMKAGGLVDDDIIMQIISDHLKSGGAPNGALFDGFPRTITQALALDALLDERGESIEQVVNIKVPDDILLGRVKNRVAETPVEERRADDSAEALAIRLVAYREQTLPVLSYYKKQSKVVEVDGTRSMCAVSAEILVELGLY